MTAYENVVGRLVCSGIVCFLALVAASTANVSSAAMLLEDSFEGSKWNPWQHQGNKTVYHVTNPVRAGKKAALIKLDPKSKNSYRTELSLGSRITFDMGKSYWYGFSIRAPGTWKKNAVDEIVVQWGGRQDKGECTKRGPPLTLRVVGGNWQVKNAGDPQAKTECKSKSRWRVKYGAGAVQKDKWVSWVFHVLWSYKDDGLLEVWKDGKRIISRRGPTTFNDAKGPMQKFGIYARRTKIPQAYYFDEWRIGDYKASLSAVAPRN